MAIQDHTKQVIDLVLSDFSEKHGLAIGIYDYYSNEIFSRKAYSNFAPLCTYNFNHPKLKDICTRDHYRRGKSCKYPILDICCCGLFNYSIPIIVENRHVGTLLCGQLLIKGYEEESNHKFEVFQKDNENIIVNKELLKRKFNNVRKVEIEYFEKLKKELEQISNLFVTIYFERKMIDEIRNELKERITNVAHEVQIYHQGSLSAAEELSEMLASSGDRGAMKIAQQLEGFIYHVGNVVTNLVWASSETNYRFGSNNILNLIYESVGYYNWYARKRGIELIISPGRGRTVLNCSSIHIQQALNNLIHNAIKYSFKGSDVSERFRFVEIKTYSDANDYFCFSIENYGIGILEEELEKLTKRRYRGYLVKDERRTGNGIGLPVVLEIIKRHKGDFEVHSVKTRGDAHLNIFTIKIPYNPELI
jgi:signal transduction histidine kinase